LGKIQEQRFVFTAYQLASDQFGRASQRLGDTLLDQNQVPLLRISTDWSTEFCDKAGTHKCEQFLALNDIDHSKTKVKNPQSHRICERFQGTVLYGFYRVAFRKKIYLTLDKLQKDLDDLLNEYNNQQPHQGKRCQGNTIGSLPGNVPLPKKMLGREQDELTLAA